MADLNTCIRGAQILDGTVTASELGSDAVTTVKILDANVTAGKLATDSVETLKIKNANVTAAKLATDSVETAKIKAANVTMAKIESGSDKQIMIAGVAGVPAYQTVSGDVTVGNTGVTAIGATKVVDSMVNDDVATGLAGAGLSASSGVMALDVNELGAAAVDVANDSIAIVDATDNSSKKESIADLATAMAGTGITATNGVLAADTVTDNIIEGDLQRESEAGDDATTVFNLTSVPIANSVHVYQRGLCVEEGSGKDFILNAGAKTVTFATAPLTGDVIQIFYIIDN